MTQRKPGSDVTQRPLGERTDLPANSLFRKNRGSLAAMQYLSIPMLCRTIILPWEASL